MEPHDSEEIASLKIDDLLQYLQDYERDDEETCNSLQHAQQKEDFNHEDDRYKLPEPKVFHSFSTNIYNNYQNSKNRNKQLDKQWRLMYRVQGKVIHELCDGFFAELYFNSENHYLLLVIKGTSSIGNVWSDIKNVSFGSKGGKLDSAFTFGEKVRVLMNKFKCKPMLLITGHSLGGYLAQIITYTITYCFEDGGKVKSRKEPMDDFGIYTIVFDSPAALKQISSIVPRDPIQPERFRLPIVNFIADVNIINSNSKVGPHLGKVISVKEFEDLNAPNKWQRIKVLPTHKIKKFEDIDLKQCQQIPYRKTVKYDEKEIQNCFFSPKIFDRLQKYLFCSTICAELVDRLPNFKISNSCIFLEEDESISAERFIPKAHLFLSQFKEKLDSGTFDGKNLIDKAFYELWKAEMMEYAHNFCLNEQWKGIVQALRDGTIIGGFKSFEEMRFTGCLIHNSFRRCSYFDYDQFNAMDWEVIDNITSTTEAMLILIVRGYNRNISHQGGEKLKRLYLVLDEDAELKLTFKVTALEERSQKYLKNTELDFMGSKVSALEIFGIELIEKLRIWEILNFHEPAVPTPKHLYRDQKISGRNMFKSAVAFARELMKKEMQFVLISSDAGMGKSTALKQIALTLQRELPNNWIVHINLFDIQTALSSAKDTLTSTRTAVEFARNMELKDRVSDEVLAKVFNRKLEEKRMVLLFDSFDEVCPFHRKTVEKLIGLLRETELQIVLTTRPHEGKNFPNANLFKLQPLSEAQIEDFIDQKFKMLGKKPPSIPEVWLNNICDKLGFWSLPLNLNMATSLYDADADIAEPSGLTGKKNIYEVFLTKSIEDSLNFKINLEKNHHQAASMQSYKNNVDKVNELYELLALCLIFQGGKINGLTKELQKTIKMNREIINRFDLVKLDNEFKSVSFLHRSYADYLIAKVFLHSHQRDMKRTALTLNKKQLERIYFEDNFHDVRKQVCQMLAASPLVTMVFFPDLISSNDKKLLEILIEGDCYELYMKLKNHVTLCFEIFNGIHPLYLALISSARKEFVRQLIDDGARFEDILNQEGVLHSAIKVGLHQEVIQHFESLKLNMDVQYDNKLPLHHAAQFGSRDLVEFLIENGADVNAKNTQDETAMFFAIEANNAEVCELLMAKGADCTQALKCAAEYGSKESFTVIYKNTPSECRHERVIDAHFEAVNSGNLRMIKHICGLPEANPQVVNSNGDTFLHCAARKGHLHCMSFILEYMNQSVDVKNRKGETALMMALEYGHDEVVEWLMEQHADIHAVDNTGRSCLHVAAKEGNLYYVEMCLDAGADINSQDKDGETALIHAIFGPRDNLPVVEYLLEKGANPEITTNNGSTCLHAACLSKSLECLKLLVELLPLNCTNKNRVTPLHLAALQCNEEIVAFLLEQAKNQNLEPVDSEKIIRLTKRIREVEKDSKIHEYLRNEILKWKYIAKDA